ncbi:MAG: [Fe-Fe] hydrogenase large subunit C-terminal domain-containing protein [Ignavibacteria bacterium]|jgi:iron only hydrogenase large subunit-like protein/nitrogen-specific signal transduction histidine kinase
MINGIVQTIPYLCKRCYSCVRECPAIAIRVENGQAVVISDRCISCGHCVTVCSQNAKSIKSDLDFVWNEILKNEKVFALVAPSFPASFPNVFKRFPSALRKLGFSSAVETAFGADLVSNIYVEELQKNPNVTIISSACPAVYNYIENYYCELVPKLAKIVSPMIAMGRYLKKNFGEDIKVVFIGPCIAKKSEILNPEVEGIIDAVLTFEEIKELLVNNKIYIEDLPETDFDEPHSFMGKSYPLAGGLLKSANISGDILEKEIIVVEGKTKVEEILNELLHNKINAKFIDILFCEGCISGPAVDSKLNYYSRRAKVIDYIEWKNKSVDKLVWKSHIYNNRDLDLTRDFVYKDKRIPTPDEEKIKEILARTNKFTRQDELNCGSCGYKTCREYAIAIAKGLAENDMCLPYLIDKIEKAYIDLKETQEQLQSAEKLASIGQLASGVAHEINNPLGTILLYTSLIKKEINSRIDNPQTIEDLDLIAEETNRCKNIVSNLLNFARQGQLRISDVDVFDVINGILKSIRIKPEFKGVSFNVESEADDTVIQGDTDQLKQIFLNIINNACEAMEDNTMKKVFIRLLKDDRYFITEISDTGNGIPKENMSKLFTPFFTTKKIGKGTGLGLAISYGIVKMHKGDIRVKSIVGEGTTFYIRLPLNNIKLN